MVSVKQVKEFWENSPLWTGESNYEPGTLEFFNEQRKIIESDGFAGKIDHRIFKPSLDKKILDLGCGIGMWITEFGLRGYQDLHAADLTRNGLDLTEKRLRLFKLKAQLSIQNAEKTNLLDKSFDHVNCLGVIHHTPDTESCISEIHRILRYNGTATISVYHKNFFLKLWPILRPIGFLLFLGGAKLKGRKRENIFKLKRADDIVRLYDGSANPVGKAYSKNSFLNMLCPYFEIEEVFLHFFPARTLPFRIPKFIHRLLDKHLGFMICATLRKKCVE